MSSQTRHEPCDEQQIRSLCGDLDERVRTAQMEEALLADLAGLTTPVNRQQAGQYRRMLDDVRRRSHRLAALARRLCS